MGEQRETTVTSRYAAYLFQADTPPQADTCFIGEVEPGVGSFAFDPWDWYRRGIITATNMIVAGIPGSGKTSTVKVLCGRSMLYGRRVWALDVKGEYGNMAAAYTACGFRVTRIVLNPDGTGVRINPMDPTVPVEARLSLLWAIATAAIGRRLTPREWRAVVVAHDTAMTVHTGDEPLLADVVHALLHPGDTQVEAMAARGGAAQVHDEGRDVGLALLNLVERELAGMFDGPTTPGIDLDAQLVVVDVSALSVDPKKENALAVAMACVTTFLQGQLDRQGVDGNLIVLLDEAWRFTRMPAMAEWLSGVFKLVRKYGALVCCVFHRLTDLEASAGDDTQHQQLVLGLLEDSQIQVLFHQPELGASKATTALGLTRAERETIGRLHRGQAIWRLGGTSTVVRTVIEHDGWEWQFIASDAAYEHDTHQTADRTADRTAAHAEPA